MLANWFVTIKMELGHITQINPGQMMIVRETLEFLVLNLNFYDQVEK